MTSPATSPLTITRLGSALGARIDGIAKATASVRIVNESVLAAALIVARARLGMAGGARGPAAPAGWPQGFPTRSTVRCARGGRRAPGAVLNVDWRKKGRCPGGTLYSIP